MRFYVREVLNAASSERTYYSIYTNTTLQRRLRALVMKKKNFFVDRRRLTAEFFRDWSENTLTSGLASNFPACTRQSAFVAASSIPSTFGNLRTYFSRLSPLLSISLPSSFFPTRVRNGGRKFRFDAKLEECLVTCRTPFEKES